MKCIISLTNPLLEEGAQQVPNHNHSGTGGRGGAVRLSDRSANTGSGTPLAWTEGMGWERGGSVAWQVFDKDSRPTAEKGRAAGAPVWSLVAAFARADGGFTIVY
jgi:hypothetical protein